MIDIDKLEENYRRRWSCGCNAGGMCGCNLDEEGYFRVWDERKPIWGNHRPVIFELTGEIRRLRALL